MDGWQPMGPIARLSIPGNRCVSCTAVMGETLVCPGCGHVDPLTTRTAPDPVPTMDELEASVPPAPYILSDDAQTIWRAGYLAALRAERADRLH